MMATPGQKIWKIRMRKCIFHFIFGVKLEKIDLWNPNEELRFSIEEVYRAGRFGEKTQERNITIQQSIVLASSEDYEVQ